LNFELLTLIGVAAFILECLGIVSAIWAVLTARTSQGAIAWAVVLVTWPLFSVPLFWIFGRNKFQGYANARQLGDLKMLKIVGDIDDRAAPFRVELGRQFGNARVLEQLAHLPFIRGNDTRLLIDGEQTFQAMFEAIDEAEDYVLTEFFIVKDDQLGREFKDRLINAAKRGCRVFLLYDDVGSQKITRTYLDDLRSGGVNVTGMKTTKGMTNRFQLNFRNHRKIVVVDGREAFVGGLNVGDEYVHRDPKLTPWRDTHMSFEGPAVLAAQIAFLEDWHWATGSVPQLSWNPEAAPGADKTMFVLPSGPDDEFETCGLFFTHIINAAQRRIWIASPYFVPDEGIVTALQLAAMRGVDVRVIIPGLPDKWLVKRAAMAYVPPVAATGVKVYEYGRGFMHQKVVLLDDEFSFIGTANFDNRSFRLNFEITIATIDKAFAGEVEKMLEQDIANSTLIDPAELAKRGLFFKVSSRVARLFSPIL
jgi:cardiolipin synthase